MTPPTKIERVPLGNQGLKVSNLLKIAMSGKYPVFEEMNYRCKTQLLAVIPYLIAPKSLKKPSPTNFDLRNSMEMSKLLNLHYLRNYQDGIQGCHILKVVSKKRKNRIHDAR